MSTFDETLEAFKHCVTLDCYSCKRQLKERNTAVCLKKTLREIEDILGKNSSLIHKQRPVDIYVSNVIEVEDEYRYTVCPTCLGKNITESDMRPKVCSWCGQRFSI